MKLDTMARGHHTQDHLRKFFPTVLGKVTKMSLSLFLLDNMCFTNIGHGTIAAISRPI